MYWSTFLNNRYYVAILVLVVAAGVRFSRWVLELLSYVDFLGPIALVILGTVLTPLLDAVLLAIEISVLFYLGIWVTPRLTKAPQWAQPIAALSTGSVALGYVLRDYAFPGGDPIVLLLGDATMIVGLLCALIYTLFAYGESGKERIAIMPVLTIFGILTGYVITLILRFSPLLEILIFIAGVYLLVSESGGRQSDVQIVDLFDEHVIGLGTALREGKGMIILITCIIGMAIGSVSIVGPVFVGDFTTLGFAATNIQSLYSRVFMIFTGLYWLRTLQRLSYWGQYRQGKGPAGTPPRRFGGVLAIPSIIYAFTKFLIPVFPGGAEVIPSLVSVIVIVCVSIGFLYFAHALFFQQPFHALLPIVGEPNNIQNEMRTASIAFVALSSSAPPRSASFRRELGAVSGGCSSA